MANKSGFILILVLILGVILLTSGIFYLNSLTSEIKIGKSQKAGTICFYLAEGGVEEAIWKIKNDPQARDKFLNTIDGVTEFSRDPALIDGGAYSVSIQNTAKGVADISSTGFYQISLVKRAQRKIKVTVSEALLPPPYTSDSALTGGAQGKEDISIMGARVNIYGGSIFSNRDINIWFLANVWVEKDAKAVRKIQVGPFSNLTVGGTRQEGIPPLDMPEIDFDSDSSYSYKKLAQAQGQVFTEAEFENMLKINPNLTLSGIVYVTGQVNLRGNQNLTVNGTLVADQSINVGTQFLKPKASLIINDDPNGPSGVLTKKKLNIGMKGEVDITGLVYAADSFGIARLFPAQTEFKGGILSRWIQIIGLRKVNITYDSSLINQSLQPTGQTPIIEIKHWEEEY